jgi:ribosome-associated protein
MPEPIDVAAGVFVPASAVRMSVARSSGPGGQNVNKVASKVELRVDPAAVVGLDDAGRARLDAAVRRRLDAAGWILVTSQRTRDQHRNLEDAREKIRALIAQALVAPKKRRKTRPSGAARERRLQDKKHRGARKQHRGRSGSDD